MFHCLCVTVVEIVFLICDSDSARLYNLWETNGVYGLWYGREISETIQPSWYLNNIIISAHCLQAFKEMLYAAQDQAPSIEGNIMPHIVTLIIYLIYTEKMAHIVVVYDHFYVV